MAKLTNVIERKPIPLSVNGVYIRDLPAKEIEAKFGNIAEEMQEKPEETITLLFNDLICDGEGETFDDVATFEEITDNLSVRAIHEIINAIPEALVPGDASGKK